LYISINRASATPSATRSKDTGDPAEVIAGVRRLPAASAVKLVSSRQPAKNQQIRVRPIVKRVIKSR
jgi:hypothetical protein